MYLTFFLDEESARTALTRYFQTATPATIVSNEGTADWNRVLPERVGDYFYKSPWVIHSCAKHGVPLIQLSDFSADHFKSTEQMVTALKGLEDTTDWSLFSWGGLAKYGMIGLLAPTPVDVGAKPVFHYRSVADFDQSFRGFLGRRTDTQFAPALWRALNGKREIPLIATFAYYEGAFTWDDTKLSYSVEGTFAGIDENEDKVSVYRVGDYTTFAYFVGLMNQVSFFDILPGSLSMNACQDLRRRAYSFDFSGALGFSPWYLIYNGGEIDTCHALFVSSDNSVISHFTREIGEALSLVTQF